MKRCKDCHKDLPKSEYHKDKTNKDRLRTRCKGCRSKLAKSYWIKTREKSSSKKRQGYERLRKNILNKYGNKCSSCSFGDWRALQVDHINGGGSTKRLQENRNWHKFYREVLEDKVGLYQLLCANCNWIKRYENKEGNYHNC